MYLFVYWCVVLQQMQGWRFGIMSEARSDDGGYKMATMEIRGDKVYSKLKFEVRWGFSV